jgi:hypothetical protein
MITRSTSNPHQCPSHGKSEERGQGTSQPNDDGLRVKCDGRSAVEAHPFRAKRGTWVIHDGTFTACEDPMATGTSITDNQTWCCPTIRSAAGSLPVTRDILAQVATPQHSGASGVGIVAGRAVVTSRRSAAAKFPRHPLRAGLGYHLPDRGHTADASSGAMKPYSGKKSTILASCTLVTPRVSARAR